MEDHLAELQRQARGQGLVLVDGGAIDALLADYAAAMQQADELCEVVDPETKPFESKYKARDLLDEIARRLEANKAIASLDKNAKLIALIRPRQAALRTKLGLICWDCEEPHNAQIELDQASAFYFPELVEKIESLAGEGKDLTAAMDSKSGTIDFEALLATLPPHAESFDPAILCDGMKCLNILGIIWSGRGQPGKAVCYLLTAQLFFNHVNARSPALCQDAAVDHAYTHNMFYLAQAYGHLQDSARSSRFCQMTLQRQLTSGLSDIKSMLEWVKNCAGIADYFSALGHYASCACALASAERILKEHVIKSLYDKFDEEMTGNHSAGGGSETGKIRPNYVNGNLNAAEIEADLHRRWAMLDVRVLKRAMDRRKALNLLHDMDEPDAVIDQMMANEWERDERVDRERLLEMRLRHVGDAGDDADAGAGDDKVCMFSRHPIAPPAHVFTTDVATFDQARLVFLRAAARIEAAKKFYVLDGCVTDHVGLLQEYSKLYHYLAEFEPDVKRRIAMESRRLDMLVPMIKSLNKVSYEVLHKQVAYELGEASLALIDLMLDKLRQKEGRHDITEKSFKKADLAKYNEYCKMGLAMFAHFICMYAQNKDRGPDHAYAHFETLSLHRLAGEFLQDADEGQVTEEEVRPFLNAHFLSCRIMSKVLAHESTLPPGSSPSNRAFFLIQCLKRYEFIKRLTHRLCERRQVDIQETFGQELKICEEMITLLPSKIDRMCYRGESGLSL